MKRLIKILSITIIFTSIGYFIEETEASDYTEEIEIRTIPVADVKESETKDWTLQYKIKNSDLLVECIVPGFSLSKEEKRGHGFLVVKMNGEKAAEMGQAAFMMKNLPPGTHEMEVTPKSYDGDSKKQSIEFEVEIPSS
ncbi:hypothetical protein D7Z54_22680 [Salibacterium salarium]|uniref:Uncharacterized protein n=1 Tax=Salibacterium salarium TaxID=284579 RepID=A0A428MYD5_9BACI|nr:hypothetical protein [Salibacterium salarium]RSL31122.1 hypothetical protein D7Z54_22680 [Salibacterium salarium]